MASREELLLEPVARGAAIIEIGPSHAPIAPKAGGWKTTIVDVVGKAELIEKFGAQGLDTSRIEDVDFIWCDGPLSGAIPEALHGAFDVLIASHVIEHAPDLVAFFNSATALLKPAGTMILAVPDKRFCFDYLRPLTLTSDVLAAAAARRSRHSRKTLFEFYGYGVTADGYPSWGQQQISGIDLSNTLESAYSAVRDAGEDEASPYIDAHAWVFTPSSFSLLMLELARLNILDWQVARISEAIGCEFHAWLHRGGIAAAGTLSDAEVKARRVALFRNILVETKQQIEFLTDGSAPPRAAETEPAMPAAADKWYEAALAVSPDHDPFRASVGRGPSWWRSLLRCGRDAAAMRAALARDAGKWELAARYYRDALDRKPRDAELWFQCGNALENAGKPNEAAVAYQKSRELRRGRR